MYIPSEAAEMTTPLALLIPSAESYVLGVKSKPTYTAASGTIFANFKTFGGTERQIDGLTEVEDTAVIVCWYRPDVKSNCRVKRLTDNAIYEIVGEPEDLEQRHVYLKFKIRRIKGGA